MGEGFYMMIGFGCVLEGTEHWLSERSWLNAEDDAYNKAERLRSLWCAEPDPFGDIPLKMGQEAEPEYFIIPLAASNLAPVPCRPQAIELICYAVPFDNLLSFWLAAISPERLEQVKQDWEQVRAITATYGITLPEGKLIYISDWD